MTKLVNPFPTDYEKFIYVSRYARWIEAENRRETWDETVTRYMDFMRDTLYKSGTPVLDTKLYDELWNSIYNFEVLPSMRCLMTAGPALERCNVAGYNCAYMPIEHIRCFDETLYILMCGTGVGFSVERQYISRLPTINEHFEQSDTIIVVSDSKAGWAKSVRELISLLYSGQIPKWDISGLRKAGARLKTFGGRSSGSDPLVKLFNFLVQTFTAAAGRKLNSLEVHDIMCMIGECVVSGGVRRSALISLSNLSDPRMRDAKMGGWYVDNPQRSIANNSWCATEKPDIGIFMDEWSSLYASKSGERGIFNRVAAQKKAASNGRRDSTFEFGTNPCSEIILRPYQFCNLTEVVVRPEDTIDTLTNKVRLAAILGTFQSTLTDFKYLRSKWKVNTEEERLLGVSLTGIMDNKIMANKETKNYLDVSLNTLKTKVVEVNKDYTQQLGINQSTATTCVKPSGTASQLVNCRSGIHAGHSAYYIRNVRCDITDPMCQLLLDQGLPNEIDGTNPNVVVFSFPIKTPDHTVLRKDLTALQHLELWKIYQDHWCEHKPSITVSVREHEWMEVGAWVYKNFDDMSGISFLPYSDHEYTQAPYQEITEEEYNERVKAMPSIAWERLSEFELEDSTIGSRDFACSGSDVCEIVDLI